MAEAYVVFRGCSDIGRNHRIFSRLCCVGCPLGMGDGDRMTQSEMAEAVAYAMAVFPNATPEVIARLKATRDYLYQSCAAPRCDQCAHWVTWNDDYANDAPNRQCEALSAGRGLFTCPPDFGCVKFRPKGK